MATIKFETKELVYFVENNKVTFAQHKITGKFVKHHIAQSMHDKMVQSAKNVNLFQLNNKFLCTIWKDQLRTYFKSFGYTLTCFDGFGTPKGLTLSKFLQLA